MKAYYKNNLKQAEMILTGEENEEEDFQSMMLQENEIPGVLKTKVRYVDNLSHYHYDISGKISLKAKHEKEKLREEDIRQLIYQLLATIKGIQKYMLEGRGILLDPQYIYCEKEQYLFCYYPPSRMEIKDEFHKLTEFFVKEVDYRDKEGVYLAYTLHKATMEEHYSIERIMEEIVHEKKEETVVDYQERMEQQEEEAAAVAEKTELWEPVRSLLERKKREKWGYWDEIHIEEDDL